jgi:hypothetical protein
MAQCKTTIKKAHNMAYNGAGTFLINSAGQPVVAGTTISETVFNALTADLATGLSTAITKDGQTTATANLPMGGFKLTNLAAGTAATDSARLGQVQSGAATLIAITGTNTIVGTLTPTLTAYAAGQQFSFVAAATNNTSMTLNIDGLGAKAITRSGATALIAGDITVGKMITVIYDGTQFQTSDARVPISSGVSGLGTGVATALGVAVTGSGSVVLSASPTLTGTMTAATISATTVNATTVAATTVNATTGAFSGAITGGVTATGSTTSRTLATRFADSANVKDFGAIGNGVANDTAAIQAAINYMNTTYSGGIVFVPAGNYYVPGGLTLKGGVELVGEGRGSTTIQAQTVDVTVIAFDATSNYAALRNLFITGYTNAAATTNAVTVAADVPVIMKDCNIWGGLAAVYTLGVDGYMENCFVAGWKTACVVSNGANWYVRCKFDTAGVAVTHAFYQGTPSPFAIMENNFVACDFSGSFTNSVAISDGTNTSAITLFSTCVFSSPISLINQLFTGFTTCEFGSALNKSAGSCSVVGSYAITPLVFSVTAPGAALAGNANIT